MKKLKNYKKKLQKNLAIKLVDHRLELYGSKIKK